MKIYYWPDGCWCDEAELEQMGHKSDDYTFVILGDQLDDDEVDGIVQELVSC